MGETNHGRFMRLAEARLNRFKNTCLLISNLSDSRYDYSTEEVNWYFDQIRALVKQVEEEFSNPMIKRSHLVLEPVVPCAKRSVRSEMCDKFHQLMESRCNRLVAILNLLLNLVNRSSYNYYSKDVRQMFDYMDDVVDITVSHFLGIGDFSFLEPQGSEERWATNR